MGTRLGKLTDNVPKCLTELNGETILGRQLRILRNLNVREILITTGPFENLIKEFVSKDFSDLSVTYVNNPYYATTNYIYSMHVVGDLIRDDILYMHGDMVFEESVLKKLLESEHKDAALLDNENKPPENDFKARVVNGKIKDIGVNFFGHGCFFLAPIYKLSKDFMSKWMDEISNFVARKESKVYAENAFNSISENLNLKPVYFGPELCMEVDTLEDLERAKHKLR